MRTVLAAFVALLSIPASLAAPTAGESASTARLPVAEAGVEGSIVRLYPAFLGRPADDAGLDHWAARYRDGLPLVAVADSFAASPEFRQAYGQIRNETFVELVYDRVLDRGPDAEGRAFWEGQLAAGRSRGSVMLAFSESAEYVARTGTAPPVAPRRLLAPAAVEHGVARVYLGLLHRWPDAGGLDHWVFRRLGGAPLTTLTDAMLAAPELAARYGATTDEQFVRLLYTEVLGRPADDAGVASWVGELAAGRTRGSVTASFTESAEMVARTRTVGRPVATGRRLLAVGDSVMNGARTNIQAIAGWTVSTDTRGCRQPTRRGDGCGAVDIPSGVDALRSARADGRLGDVVVIHLGNNGPMSAAQFDEVMAQVLDVPGVIWLNQHEPRSYEGPNNRVIAAGVARHANTELIDWHGLAQGQPWFSTDGIHLSHAGRQAMADLIAARINS